MKDKHQLTSPESQTASRGAIPIGTESRVCADIARQELKVGMKVYTTVTVASQTQRMSLGQITAIHDGYCEVDVMSLHGGAPWIQIHTNLSLMPVIEEMEK